VIFHALVTMISVIVPIYKVENYLAACVDSILNSTYKDLEVILVDDGSPDGCPAICDSYAAKDSRVQVIHQPNQGVSAARNAGLKVAKGEYIAFADGDDVIHPRMLEVLLKAINRGDYDFSMVYGVMVQDKGVGYNYVDDAAPVSLSSFTIITRDEYIQRLADMTLDAYQFHVIWNKLYKRDFVVGQQFKKVPFEDVEWLNRVNLKLTKGVLVEAEMYYYIQRGESTMHATNILTMKMNRIKTYYICLKETTAEETDCRPTMFKALYSAIFEARRYARGTALAQQVESQVSQIYQETKHELMHCGLRSARKLILLSFYHIPILYDLFARVLLG